MPMANNKDGEKHRTAHVRARTDGHVKKGEETLTDAQRAFLAAFREMGIIRRACKVAGVERHTRVSLIHRGESQADEPALGTGTSLRQCLSAEATLIRAGLQPACASSCRPTFLPPGPTACPTSDIAPPRSRAAPRFVPSRRDPRWCARSSRRDGRPGPRG